MLVAQLAVISLASAYVSRVHGRVRACSPTMAVPDAALSGISMERQLGELKLSEIETAFPDRDAILSGQVVQASMAPEQVTVGLFYGQLTGGSMAGTRVLVKCYSSDENNRLAAARAALAGPDSVRAQLESLLSSPGGLSEGISLAETIAENEFAAHTRVQATAEDIEKRGVCRMLGMRRPTYTPGEDAVVLAAFPWRGEAVRMALPTQLPPTLRSWADQRGAGETPGAKLWDKSVPQQALQSRGRFLQSVLRGALTGLSTLHGAGLLHQGLSPSAVMISSSDDRNGEKVRGTLCELGFCRDAPSLSLAHRAGPDGDELPQYAGLADPLGTGLLDRACMGTRRPGDPAERASFGRADDIREFGMLMLECFILGNAPPDAPLTPLQLRSLCDGPFAQVCDGMRTDGVDVGALRDYLAAEARLQVGDVGGVDVLDLNDRSGWQLVGSLLSGEWEDRPTAEEALQHAFWEARIFI
jgi:hypothetical protein